MDFDEDTNQITFSADLVSQFKQALKEYAEETNRYFLLWSVGFSELEYSDFCRNKAVYDSVLNVLNTAPSGTIKYNITSGTVTVDGVKKKCIYLYISCFDNLKDVGFVNHWNSLAAYNYSMSTWEVLKPPVYCVRFFEGDDVIASWDDFKSRSFNVCTDKLSSYESHLTVSCFQAEDGSYFHPAGILSGWSTVITRVRTPFRIFYSADDMMDYSLRKQSVYFSKDFYEDTGSLTVPLEDLSKSISDLNGLLEKFRDSLPSDKSLTEDQLEEQLQKFLDEFFKRMQEGGSSGGSGSGSGGGGGSSSWSDSVIGDLFGYLEGIGEMLAEGFSALADELSVVIGQLDFISMEIEDMTQDQVEQKTDSFLSQLTSMFGEVADLVKTKFPFSMPWDIGNFFSVLGGDTVEVRAPDGGIRLVNAYAAVPAAYTDDAAVPAVISQEMSGSGAPVFRLPIVVASAGIDEEIVVDLSSFEYVHLISRGMLTILYCLALVNMTFKIVDLGKGLGFKDD